MNVGSDGRTGFLPMNTAMAMWADQKRAIANGLVCPFDTGRAPGHPDQPVERDGSETHAAD